MSKLKTARYRKGDADISVWRDINSDSDDDNESLVVSEDGTRHVRAQRSWLFRLFNKDKDKDKPEPKPCKKWLCLYMGQDEARTKITKCLSNWRHLGLEDITSSNWRGIVWAKVKCDNGKFHLSASLILFLHRSILTNPFGKLVLNMEEATLRVEVMGCVDNKRPTMPLCVIQFKQLKGPMATLERAYEEAEKHFSAKELEPRSNKSPVIVNESRIKRMIKAAKLLEEVERKLRAERQQRRENGEPEPERGEDDEDDDDDDDAVSSIAEII